MCVYKKILSKIILTLIFSILFCSISFFKNNECNPLNQLYYPVRCCNQHFAKNPAL